VAAVPEERALQEVAQEALVQEAEVAQSRHLRREDPVCHQ
jgi:hypothetical protein